MVEVLDEDIRDTFRAFLNIHWLRPEAALMKTYDYMQLRTLTMRAPSMDMTCGDGISSFIWAGGRFGIDFDMFRSVRPRDFDANEDVFDTYDPARITPDITERPGWHFTTGVDRLDTAIAKARHLDFYEETRVHDCNQALPFDDGSFETIFSTTAFAVERQAELLREVRRVLRPGGRFIARIHDRAFRDDLPYGWYQAHGWEWAKLVDRGIWRDNSACCMTIEEWLEAFERAGLTVERHIRYLPHLVYRMYSIGFRPMFPAFMEMYDRLSDDDRREVKKTWVDSLYRILVDFCRPGWMPAPGDAPMVHMMVLSKQ